MQSSQARPLIEQLLSMQSSSTRVIVVNPEFRMRHLVLSILLGNDPSYTRLNGTDLSVVQLQEQTALRPSGANRRPNRKEQLIVIDECDRAQPTALREFVRTVLALYDNIKLILLSRLVPVTLLDDAQLRTQVRFVPIRENTLLSDYVVAEGKIMEVRAFGSGRVLRDGLPITDWEGTLPRNLFFFMVDKGVVTRDEIFSTFWQEMKVKSATNVFHVTKRKVTEVIKGDLTRYGGGYYHISSDLNVIYDVGLFNQFYNLSQITTGTEAIDVLESAIEIYRGDFLFGVTMEWVENRRAALRWMFNEMLTQVARLYLAANQKERAYGAYVRASTQNLQREDIVQQILILAREFRYYDEGVQVYERLEAELKRAMKIAPSAATRRLYEALLADRDRS